MDTNSVGEYKCQVSNTFGVSERIFDVTFEEGGKYDSSEDSFLFNWKLEAKLQ